MELQTRVIKIVADELGIPVTELTPDSRFQEDYGIDEFGVAELVLRVNDEFAAELTFDDVEAVVTVRDLVEAVREHSREGAAPNA